MIHIISIFQGVSVNTLLRMHKSICEHEDEGRVDLVYRKLSKGPYFFLVSLDLSPTPIF